MEPHVKLTSKTEGKSGELVGEMSLVEMVSVKELVVAQKERKPSRACSGGFKFGKQMQQNY